MERSDFLQRYTTGGIAIGHTPEDVCFKLRRGRDADLPQERAGHLAEERFHQVQPGTMLGGVNVPGVIRPVRQAGARVSFEIGAE